MSNDTVLNRLRALGPLSRSEAKLAALLEKERGRLAFETIQTISDKAGVGKATVGRFIARLGFASFSDFMESLRDEVVERLDTPAERYSVNKLHGTADSADPFGAFIDFTQRNLEEMRATIDGADVREAARILLKAPGTLYVIGGATSQGLAYFFHMLAMYFRERVVLLDANPLLIAHSMIGVTERDALLAIMHYRFSAQTVQAARLFDAKDAGIVLITDREHTPISDIAAVQLVAKTDSPSLFASRCGALLLLEAIIAAMVPLEEKKVLERFSRFEELRDELGAFARWPEPKDRKGKDLHNQGKPR